MWLDAGVRRVRLFDPGTRPVSVSATGGAVRALGENDVLDGETFLFQFQVEVADLFQPW